MFNIKKQGNLTGCKGSIHLNKLSDIDKKNLLYFKNIFFILNKNKKNTLKLNKIQIYKKNLNYMINFITGISE